MTNSGGDYSDYRRSSSRRSERAREECYCPAIYLIVVRSEFTGREVGKEFLE